MQKRICKNCKQFNVKDDDAFCSWKCFLESGRR